MISSTQRGSALRRESIAARHIPYTAHVAANVVKTAAGDFVQVLRLGGASFESADDEDLNNWHERLNVTWRNVAGPNVALWTHIIRRRERTMPCDVASQGFADRLASKYRRRLANETLMVNELYLSLIYRPVTGAAPTLLAKALSSNRAGGTQVDLADSLDACDKLGQTVSASLARYEPESLGVYSRGARTYSRLLEF